MHGRKQLDPDILLSRLQQEELKQTRGRLKIFFGACAGVGKTYAMLEAAHKVKDVRLLVGYVEAHGRKDTEGLLAGLDVLPPKMVQYKSTNFAEFDIDEALRLKPDIILVDELAHTNATGCRNLKRYQDVLELLEAGISVYTTLNVQHVESLNDVVAQITKVSIRERVPDSVLERADEIELVDLAADKLLERLEEGKVYFAEQARAAMQSFFRKGNLIALRELALRYTADRVVADMDAYRLDHQIKHPWPATERLVVCISPSPLATRLVRGGKRMAEALHAKWTVLYVEGPRQSALSAEDKSRVAQTLRLAEQLGADTLELSGDDVPELIINYAKQFNASKIIIGKPLRARWREIIFGSVVDSVIRMSGVIDVYVINGDEGATPSGGQRQSRRALYGRGKPSDYALAMTLVLIATVVARWMSEHFDPTNVVMIYLLAIVVVASRYGRGPSIMASVVSVALFDFFCVPPYFTFVVSDTQYIITFVVMLLVALVVSTLTVVSKQQTEAARLRETSTQALFSISRELSSTLDTEGLLRIGVAHIGEVFDCRVAVCQVLSGSKVEVTVRGADNHSLDDVDLGIAAWVQQNRQPAGAGTNTLPGARAIYLPLIGAQKLVGVLAVQANQELEPNGNLPAERLRLLETFANQMALACERAELSFENESSHLQIKTEQLRNALLSSVSHDLRTPLATISGAASSILESSQTLAEPEHVEMISSIYQESMRLNRLVGNLLDMTRLQSGNLNLTPQILAVDEVVGAALSYVEERLRNHRILTSISSDLPFIKVDEILIQQVLVNLLENADKYAPPGSPIEISASGNGEDNTVTISVGDHGPGIKDERKKIIFEKFYREEPSLTSGAGLGLAICHGIVEAHSGRIWVEDNPAGGALFKFTVPSTILADLKCEGDL